MANIRFVGIIVTYRCNSRCQMCHTWKHPSDPSKEIGLEVYKKLPFVEVVNLTGGEPFMREDLDEVVALIKNKTKRLVISSNGYFTDKIVALFQKHRDIGIRISIDGLRETNDELRGIPGGFDRGLKSLKSLYDMGIKDIGFGMTICDKNVTDILSLYKLSKALHFEFATAAIHNSFYFHKLDNKFTELEKGLNQLSELINELLRSPKLKDWFRAYFNYGLMSYISGQSRLLPCNMGFDSFFLDPFGEIYPCNVMQESMGNLKEKTFEEIWYSLKALDIRKKVENCHKNCWMVGSVSQQIYRDPWKVISWIMKHKFFGRRV